MSISKADVATQYPGFPDFVHEIMVHIGNDKTSEEVAELVNAPGIVNAIEERIKLEQSRWPADPYKEGSIEYTFHDDNLCAVIN